MPYTDKEKQKSAQLDWYYKNKAKVAARQVELRAEFLEWYNQLKAQPCTDCGNQFPSVCMQWDHIGTAIKVDKLSVVKRNRNKAKVLAEIAKCELVCANCHAIRTHERGTYFGRQATKVVRPDA